MQNCKIPFPKGTKIAVSWSGGKDSCLALDRAVQAGAIPVRMLTMMREDGERSRSHALPVNLLQMQADSLGLSLDFRSATWQSYEAEFIDMLKKAKADGVKAVVFGDIDLEPHRQWEEKVCQAAGLGCWLPLWGENRETLVAEVVAKGYQARITTVNGKFLPGDFVGRAMSQELIAEFHALGVDPCGENGEFHTVVTAGPLFRTPVNAQLAQTLQNEGYFFADWSYC